MRVLQLRTTHRMVTERSIKKKGLETIDLPGTNQGER